MSKPLTQADYVMTVETARDRALLIVAQDTDAPKLADRLDAKCMRVLVAELDALRASLAAAEDKNATLMRDLELACRDLAAVKLSRDAAEARLADEVRHADELAERLVGVHWVQPMYNGSPSCSWCGKQQHQHTLVCGLDTLLDAHAARRAGKEETR